MDEKNSDQALLYDENEKMTIEPVKNLDPKLFATVVLLILVAVTVVILILDKTSNHEPTVLNEPVPTPEAEVVPEIITEPEKVSVGKNLPEGFPKELVLEEGVDVKEGYSVHYSSTAKKQLTAIFESKNTIKENFEAYEKFLTYSLYFVLNKFQSENISSIYAVKINEEGEEDIANLTLESIGTTTLVSISLLKN